MRLDLDAWTESATAAATVATRLRELLDTAVQGLPPPFSTMVARVGIGTSGPTVQLWASASAAELDELLMAAPMPLRHRG